MTTTEIVNAIMNGEHDEWLDSVKDACRQRQKILDLLSYSQVRIGDRVRVTDRCTSPKGLIGYEGTVKSIDRNTQKITMDLDYPVSFTSRGRSWHRGIRMPLGLYEKVS